MPPQTLLVAAPTRLHNCSMTDVEARARERAWARQWSGATRALEVVRQRDLSGLSNEAARIIAEEILSMPVRSDLPERRRGWSGLVEWQRALRRCARP